MEKGIELFSAAMAASGREPHDLHYYYHTMGDGILKAFKSTAAPHELSPKPFYSDSYYQSHMLCAIVTTRYVLEFPKLDAFKTYSVLN